jgi:hypothetical protein
MEFSVGRGPDARANRRTSVPRVADGDAPKVPVDPVNIWMHKNPLSRGFRETTYNALFWRTPAHLRVQSELVMNWASNITPVRGVNFEI